MCDWFGSFFRVSSVFLFCGVFRCFRTCLSTEQQSLARVTHSDAVPWAVGVRRLGDRSSDRVPIRALHFLVLDVCLGGRCARGVSGGHRRSEKGITGCVICGLSCSLVCCCSLCPHVLAWVAANGFV